MEELTPPILSACVSLTVVPRWPWRAHPAGVPEGGPGAKAGEGEGRGAAQGWHGDPRPHPQLCGKVSSEVWRRGEW